MIRGVFIFVILCIILLILKHYLQLSLKQSFLIQFQLKLNKMGNICCQTEAVPNPLQVAFNQNEYSVETLPKDDQLLIQWLAEQKIQISENNPDPAVKTMKHSFKDRYYHGTWKDGVPEGKGLIYQPNKLLFSGNFHHGLPEGESVIKFIEQGCDYSGQLKDGKANGKGTINSTRDKFQFAGQWENSKPKNGVLTFVADQNISSIQIQDFEKGLAKIHYKDLRVYEGQINTNKLLPNGKGKVTFGYNSQKTSYDGQWHNGYMHGKGLFQWMDSSKYDGQFVNGKKQGFGTFIFPNGNYYEGYWVGGKQEGAGTLYNKNKQEIKKGTWVNGVFSIPLQKQQYQNQSRLSAERHSKIMQQVESRIKKENEIEQLHKSGIKQRLSQVKSEMKDQILTIPQNNVISEEKHEGLNPPPKSVVISVEDTIPNPKYSSNINTLIPNQNLTANVNASGLNSNLNNPPSNIQNPSFILNENKNKVMASNVNYNTGLSLGDHAQGNLNPSSALYNIEQQSWLKEKSPPGI